MAERNEDGTFKKGVSGNPHGRPPREREDRYYQILYTTVTFEKWKEIVKKAVMQAEKGDSTARKWLADYLIGAPIQRTEQTGADGGPLRWVVKFDGEDDGGGEG